jgi:hypothetical protein
MHNNAQKCYLKHYWAQLNFKTFIVELILFYNLSLFLVKTLSQFVVLKLMRIQYNILYKCRSVKLFTKNVLQLSNTLVLVHSFGANCPKRGNK